MGLRNEKSESSCSEHPPWPGYFPVPEGVGRVNTGDKVSACQGWAMDESSILMWGGCTLRGLNVELPSRPDMCEASRIEWSCVCGLPLCRLGCLLICVGLVCVWQIYNAAQLAKGLVGGASPQAGLVQVEAGQARKSSEGGKVRTGKPARSPSECVVLPFSSSATGGPRNREHQEASPFGVCGSGWHAFSY